MLSRTSVFLHNRTTQAIASQIRDRHVLRVCAALDGESNRRGKSDLNRIVSMLTRLIQRTEIVAENRIEYEYEYREAEYEHEGRDTAKS